MSEFTCPECGSDKVRAIASPIRGIPLGLECQDCGFAEANP